MPDSYRNILPFDNLSENSFDGSIEIWGRFLKETACMVARRRRSEVVERKDLVQAWEICRKSSFEPVETEEDMNVLSSGGPDVPQTEA